MCVGALTVLDALLDKAATLGAENERLKAKVSRLEEENAALKADLKEADHMGCKHCINSDAGRKKCRHDCCDCPTPCVCSECCNNNLWRWRGVNG